MKQEVVEQLSNNRHWSGRFVIIVAVTAAVAIFVKKDVGKISYLIFKCSIYIHPLKQKLVTQ